MCDRQRNDRDGSSGERNHCRLRNPHVGSHQLDCLRKSTSQKRKLYRELSRNGLVSPKKLSSLPGWHRSGFGGVGWAGPGREGIVRPDLKILFSIESPPRKAPPTVLKFRFRKGQTAGSG